MDTLAFVFSGQGAQYPGMGKELYETSPAARRVFDAADAIRPGTSKQCFEGTAEELAQTINTQPCVFCMDLAAAESLREAGLEPCVAAGFSLGEVAALTFAGAFDFETGFRLVCRRAEFMQEAAERYDGAMVAVLRLPPDTVKELCERFENTYPVNYNSAAQTVVALLKANQEAFVKAVQEAGGKAVPLAVSGGFHSPFMDRAAEQLREVLDEIEMKDPKIPVYANSTALPYDKDPKDLLARQVNHPVLWQKTVEAMAAGGIETMIEVGPGKTLCGLIKKTAPGVRILNVENTAGVEAAKEAFSAE
ncbi:ACP S-malonyltransferase [Caproiciproducens sp. LBM24188]|nr:ACP S-malonyltransferase [Oscillospiraceae bacterium]HHV31480.1 ACP S-malonyltransferase [Clostridiales bacterium]